METLMETRPASEALLSCSRSQDPSHPLRRGSLSAELLAGYKVGPVFLQEPELLVLRVLLLSCQPLLPLPKTADRLAG